LKVVLLSTPHYRLVIVNRSTILLTIK
jgi:hypothetical protein